MTTPVDLLIKPQWLLPIVPRAAVLEDHALAVRGGEIVALGPVAQLEGTLDAAETLALPNQVLMPGLVNAHTHSAMSLLRGVGDDLPLEEWLNERMWPVEGALADADFVGLGTDLALAEMIRGGTTCANDMYFFPDVAARRALANGFRMAVGMIVVDFPTRWATTSDEYFQRGLAVHDEFRQESLITTMLAAHAPYTVGDENLSRICTLSNQMDLKVHIHLHETAVEVENSRRDLGLRPFDRIRKLGLVNENLLAVHMTQLEPNEIAACAEAGVSVLHCPESNLKLASGLCPVEALRQAGVNVALGTDGAASNNDLDMFGELRTAALIGKAAAASAEAVPAWYALEMATINGAKALGLEEQIGSLEVGKRADLISFAMEGPELMPLFDVVSQLVYAGNRRQVRHVWVDGAPLLADGSLTRVDLPALRSRVEETSLTIQNILDQEQTK
ncbi:MAG: TRZ/ATZ family hydrolase [Pseudomonadota bacterium]